MQNERRETRVWSSLKSRIKAIIGTRSVRSRKGKGIDGRQESGKLIGKRGPICLAGTRKRKQRLKPEARGRRCTVRNRCTPAAAVGCGDRVHSTAGRARGSRRSPRTRCARACGTRSAWAPRPRRTCTPRRGSLHRTHSTAHLRRESSIETNQRIHLQIHSHRIRIQLTVQSHTRAVRRQRAARRH